MPNELLLALSVAVFFLMTVGWYRLFGERGIYCWTVIATILANIEVLILVRAFGMEQTLGNVLFASTFLATDILSELHGKKHANRAVNIGIAASVSFVIISQSWLLYTPSADDRAFESIGAVFANTPRLIAVSLVVYAISQRLDVALYHRWWDFTSRKTGDRNKFLWLRNNASTMTSQLVNAFAFNFGAFWGEYDVPTLVSISVSTFVIYIFTSLLDTPFLYLARRIKNVRDAKNIEFEGAPD
jgi:uncharacterized integral membrane protein (TIGR00697 family)